MKSKKIEKFLSLRGYKYFAPSSLESSSVVAFYYQVMWKIDDLPFCLLNDKPPQIYVKEWLHKPIGEKNIRGVEVGISNESPDGWIDFKFYGLDEKEFVEKFDRIEARLLSVWRHLFEKI